MPARRGVYLLTHPRSASNLFQTMMSKQRSHGADVQSSGYHFFDAAFPLLCQMDRGSISGWTEAEREVLYEPYKAGFEKLTNELANAEKEVREFVSLQSINENLSLCQQVRSCFADLGNAMSNYLQLWRDRGIMGLPADRPSAPYRANRCLSRNTSAC
jgi:hypothetical protein